MAEANVAKNNTTGNGSQAPEPVVIKKYANRRLYNTKTSSYVTLDHLCQMVKDGTDFVVHDAKSGADITHSVLTQIIVGEEGKGHYLLPVNFLRHLISFYGDNLQYVVPGYLDFTMKNFCSNKERLRKNLKDALGGFFPFGQFEEMSKQNIALFQQALKMFSHFGCDPEEKQSGGNDSPKEGNSAIESGEIEDLEGRLSALQRQIDALTAKNS